MYKARSKGDGKGRWDGDDFEPGLQTKRNVIARNSGVNHGGE
jgi:hypothetical protein